MLSPLQKRAKKSSKDKVHTLAELKTPIKTGLSTIAMAEPTTKEVEGVSPLQRRTPEKKPKVETLADLQKRGITPGERYIPRETTERLHARGITTIGPPKEGARLEEPEPPIKTYIKELKQQEREKPEFRTPIRIPFRKVGKPSPISVPKTDVITPFVTSLGTGLVELIPSLYKTITQIPEMLKKKELPQLTGEERALSAWERGSAIRDSLVEEGMDPVRAETLAEGAAGITGIIDVWFGGVITKGVIRAGIKSTERNVIREIAWSKLGKPKTLKGAESNWKTLQKAVHPDKPGGSEILSRELNKSMQVLRKEGLPNKVSSNARRILQGLEKSPEEFMRTGFTPVEEAPHIKPAGLLPGTRPAKPKKFPVGLSAEEMEEVGKFNKGDIVKITNKATGKSQERVVINVLSDGLTVMRKDGVGIPGKAPFSKWDVDFIRKGELPEAGPTFGELEAMEKFGIETEAEAGLFREAQKSDTAEKFVEAQFKDTKLPPLKKITDRNAYIKQLGFEGKLGEVFQGEEEWWAQKSTPNQYYHIGTEEIMEFNKLKSRFDPTTRGGGISQINGMYLGRDPKALSEFYGMIIKDEMGKMPVISSFKMAPKWLDLSKKVDENKFLSEVSKKYDVKQGKTKEFGDALEKETIARGYDGVRYFDPYATGEEFVLVKKPKTKSQLTDLFNRVKGEAPVGVDIQYRFHETDIENLESIKKQGLKPTRGQYGRGVYFTPRVGKNAVSGEGLIVRTTKKNLDELGYQEWPNEQGWTDASRVPPEILQYSKDGGKTWFNSEGEIVVKREVPAAKPAIPTFEKLDKFVEPFEGFQDLTTQVLNLLKGKKTISKQFIQDALKRQGIKKAEKDIIGEVLEEYSAKEKIPVKEFADKVRTQLIPLDNSTMGRMSPAAGVVLRGGDEDYIGFEPRYPGITLEDSVRGDVAVYGEIIYESPIKNEAIEKHWTGIPHQVDQAGEIGGYYGHVRYEDLTKKGETLPTYRGGDVRIEQEMAKKAKEIAGDIRRIIEMQSDLMQGRRLEEEIARYEETLREAVGREGEEVVKGELRFNTKEAKRSLEGLRRLRVHRNHWWERMTREEIRRAAQSAKKKLQFPTGKTAMRVEGLDQGQEVPQWWMIKNGNMTENPLTPDSVKVGETIAKEQDASRWIVTENIGDGKFKAVPKEQYKNALKGGIDSKTGKPLTKDWIKRQIEIHEETFDISGKTGFMTKIGGERIQPTRKNIKKIISDITEEMEKYSEKKFASRYEWRKLDAERNKATTWRFYERDVADYIEKNYNAKRITDEQGVEWFEVKITPEDADAPVVAFTRKKRGKLITIDEAKQELGRFFNPEEVKFLTHGGMIKDKQGEVAFGKSASGLIEVVEEKGKVRDKVVYHEAFHQYLQTIASKNEKQEMLNEVKRRYLIKEDVKAEEQLADSFADYVAGRKTFKGKLKSFFDKIISTIRKWIGKRSKIKENFDEIMAKSREAKITKKARKKVPKEAPAEKLSINDVTPEEIQEEFGPRYNFFNKETDKWLKASDNEARQNAYDYVTRDFPELGEFLRNKNFGKDRPKEAVVYRVGATSPGLNSVFTDRGQAQSYADRMGVEEVNEVVVDTSKIVPTMSGSGEIWVSSEDIVKKSRVEAPAEIEGYRKKVSPKKGIAGTFYFLEQGAKETAIPIKELEKQTLEFTNLLRVPNKEVYPFAGLPSETLARKWFSYEEVKKETKRLGLTDEEEYMDEEGWAMDVMVAREAKKRGYDGIKYGDYELQDLRTTEAPAIPTAERESVTKDIIEELEISEAGRQVMVKPPGYEEPYMISEPSTFPRWIPEELRLKELVNKIIEHLKKGTEPLSKNVRQKELFDVVNRKIDSRLGIKEEEYGELEEIKPEEVFGDMVETAPQLQKEKMKKVAEGYNPKLPLEKQKIGADNYLRKLHKNIERVGGINTKNLTGELNTLAGYNFKNEEELQNILSLGKRIAENKELVAKVEKSETSLRKRLAKERPKRIKMMTKKKPSPVVEIRKRESTLLKERIKKIQKSAKSKADKEAAIARLKNEYEARLEKATRKGELKALRVGITERIKGITRGVREGTISKREDILQAGKELKNTLKEAGVSSEDAKWFTATFKNIKGVEDLAAKMPTIEARIERLANAREIRKLKADIKEEIKETKPKVGQKKALESKFGPEVQKQMDFLRGETKESEELTGRITEKGNVISGIDGSREKALAKIEKNINTYGTAEEGITPEIPPEIVQQNALLNMIGIKEMSVEELRATFKNIKSLKEKGVLESLIGQSNKEADLGLKKDTAIEEFKPERGKIGKFFGLPESKPTVIGEAGRRMHPIVKIGEVMDDVLLSERNLLEKLTFTEEFKTADWVREEVRVARNKHYNFGVEHGNKKIRKFKEIFGEKKLGKTVEELNKEKTVFEGKDSLENEITMKLSQMEAGYWYALTKDSTNLPIFIRNMNFTPEMFKALDDFVEPKTKQYVDYLQNKWLQDLYNPINERYKVKFGMNMPRNPDYMSRMYSDKPIEEEITNLLVGEDFPAHPSTVPSGVKQRVGSKAQFRKISIESVMRRQLEQMNQFIHFDEAISDMRKVFTDPEVKEIILSQAGGKDRFKFLTKKIDDIARGGTAAKMTLVWIDRAIGNFTQASLMAPNFVPFVKQLTSMPAFTIGRGSVTYPELISGEIAFWQNPVGWTKMFSKSDFIFQRLSKGFSRETALAFRRGEKDFTIKEVDMTLEKFLLKSLKTPTRGGDMVPILPGMTAKYIQTTKKLQRAGKLSEQEIHERALAEAENLASRTQVSPHTEDLGHIRTANSIGKMITMYTTQPIQLLRETIGAGRRWNRGQATTGELIRTIITTWIVIPQLFQFIADGFDWNKERQRRALILGPINYYPAISNLITLFYDAFVKGETWKGVGSAASPLFSIPEEGIQGFETLNDIMTKGGEVKDWAEFAENIYTTFALLTGKVPSEAPRTVEGIIDLAKGDADDPRRIMWSEWALDKQSENAGISPSGGGGFEGSPLQRRRKQGVQRRESPLQRRMNINNQRKKSPIMSR